MKPYSFTIPTTLFMVLAAIGTGSLFLKSLDSYDKRKERSSVKTPIERRAYWVKTCITDNPQPDPSVITECTNAGIKLFPENNKE